MPRGTRKSADRHIVHLRDDSVAAHLQNPYSSVMATNGRVCKLHRTSHYRHAPKAVTADGGDIVRHNEGAPHDRDDTGREEVVGEVKFRTDIMGASANIQLAVPKAADAEKIIRG